MLSALIVAVAVSSTPTQAKNANVKDLRAMATTTRLVRVGKITHQKFIAGSMSLGIAPLSEVAESPVGGGAGYGVKSTASYTSSATGKTYKATVARVEARAGVSARGIANSASFKNRTIMLKEAGTNEMIGAKSTTSIRGR